MTNNIAREAVSARHLLDLLKPQAVFAQGLVITSLPRGILQIAQPINVNESMLRAYSEGLHSEDRLSWQAMLKGKAVKLGEAFTEEELGRSQYVQKIIAPLGVKYAVAIPLAAPVLDGYPGAVTLLRTADQGDFSAEEIATLEETVKGFDQDLATARQAKRSGDRVGNLARPGASFVVFDSTLQPVLPVGNWTAVDEGLRNQMTEQARRQLQSMNGHETALHRINLPDSHGDQWVFNRVAYKRLPALGDGPYTFICLQPDSGDWSTVKPADFQADPELSRLMPAVKFMHTEYSRGPTLTEISQQVKLSPFHFHRRFTELLGMTPKQYMLACQIHQAKSELLAGQKELAQIAKECGFAHQSHFTSRFKQATGLTPTRWRRMAFRRTA